METFFGAVLIVVTAALVLAVLAVLSIIAGGNRPKRGPQ